MFKKKKGKHDEDVSDGAAVLGALGLSLPDMNDLPGEQPPVVHQPVAEDDMRLSFGSQAPVTKPVARPAPAQPVAATTTPKKLPPLPALPAFVKPEDIKEVQGFDSPPVQGTGKIKQITWNIKVAEQAANVVSRQSRSLSPLMEEALNQATHLRDMIKQQAPVAAAPVAQPKPAPRPQPQPQQAPVAVTPVAQPKPAPRPQPQPQQAPVAAAPVAQPKPAVKPQLKPAAAVAPQPRAQPEPERVVISKPVQSITGETLVAHQPIERTMVTEARAVMTPTATGAFGATAQQGFTLEEMRSKREARAAAQPAVAAPSFEQPEPEYQEVEAQPAPDGTDKMLPSGRRICGKCGGSNFREDDDKTKPLSFTPPYLFAKKHTCKDCGKLFGSTTEDTTRQPAPRQQPAAAHQQPVAARPAPARHVQTSWEDAGGETNVRPSQVAAQQGPATGYDAGYAHAQEDEAGGRLVCPNCGSTSFNVIQDKTRPISYGMGGMGAVYAKVHQCRKCGAKVD